MWAVLLIAGCLQGATPADSAGIDPEGALLRSMLLPGWGQWANGHPVKGVLLAAAEVVLAGMALREQHMIADPIWDPHRKRRNTYMLWWLGVRLYGMADAYVDAHLSTFDEGEDLKIPEERDVGDTQAGGGIRAKADTLQGLPGVHLPGGGGTLPHRHNPQGGRGPGP